MGRVGGSRGVALLACLAIAVSLPLGGRPSDVRSGDRNAYALTGARVVAARGRVIENGVVVVRGGIIEAVGPQGKTTQSLALSRKA